MSEKIEKTIYDRLAATAGVTNLVSTNIFFVNADQGAALPYITLNRLSTAAVLTSDGPTDTKTTNATIQIDAWAATYSAVKAIADAIRATLFGYSDSSGDPAVGPVLMVSENDLTELPETGARVPVYRVSQDYSCWYAD